MNPPADILRTLAALRFRLFLADFLNGAARGLLIVAAGIVACAAWSQYFAAASWDAAVFVKWALIGSAIVFAGAALRAWLRRPSLRATAQLADTRAGTRDRLLAVLAFSETPAGGLGALAVQESAAALRGQSFRAHFPVRPPVVLRWLGVPLATLLLLAWHGAQLSDAAARQSAEIEAALGGTTRQLEEIARQLADKTDPAQDEARRRLAERLKESAERMRAEAGAGGDPQKAALRELARLEDLVREMRQPAALTPGELQAISAALSQHESTRDDAKDIADGKLPEAAKKLAEAAKSPDPQAAEQIERTLREALQRLAEKKEQLSKQLEDIRERARQSAQAGEQQAVGEQQAPTSPQTQELLKQIAQALQQMGTKPQDQKSDPQKGGQQAQKAGGKPMSDDDLKKLLSALQQMKDQQGQPQEGNGPGGKPDQPEPGEGDGQPRIAVQSFVQPGSDGPPQPDGEPSIPTGKPGTDRDTGTTETPFGQSSPAPGAAAPDRLTGKLGEGESLTALTPNAAPDGSKASRRYRELYEAAAPAAEDAVNQEAIPLGSRFLIKRYFESIRPRQ